MKLRLTILLIQVWGLLALVHGLCIDGYHACQQCENAFGCSRCAPSYALTPDKLCSRCLDIHCLECTSDFLETCSNCVTYFTASSSGICQLVQFCTVLYCVECPSSPAICTQCDPLIQRIGWSNNQCLPCVDPLCVKCTDDILVCESCQNGCGIIISGVDTTCMPCSDYQLSCAVCSTDARLCMYCLFYFGINVTDTLKRCVSCADPLCLNCGWNSLICQHCMVGYGLTPTGCKNCSQSASTCQMCKTDNLLKCQTCPTGRYLIDGVCQCITPNCRSCGVSSTCDICRDGYFKNSNGLCQSCPYKCSLCYLDQASNSPACTNCSDSLYTIYGSSQLCRDTCGDYLIFENTCQNQVGRPYDGCNDDCQIQDNFTCPIVNPALPYTGVCEYKGPIQLKYLYSNVTYNANERIIVLQVFPPLYAFSITLQQQFLQIFRIDNQGITIKNIEYSKNKSTFSFLISYSQNIDQNQNIVIDFRPGNISTQDYFENRFHQKIVVIFGESIYFYTSTSLGFVNIILYLCWAVVILAWVSCVLSLIFRKLAGLQAFIIVQISWLSVLFLNAPLLLPLQYSYPLKYSSGYNYPSFVQTTQTLRTSPYTHQFTTEKYSLVNNFNINIVLNLIAIIGIIVTSIKLKHYAKNHPNIEQNKQQMKQFEKLVSRSQFCFQMLMYSCMVNLLYFFAVSILFFSYAGFYLDVPSLTIFSIQSVIIILNLVKFGYDPSVYDYFRFSFKQNCLAMLHFWIYIFVYISTVGLLILFPVYPYAPLIPSGLLFVYTLAYRPYKQVKQNIRSSFNLLVLCSILFFNLYMDMFWQNDPNSQMMYLLFMVNIGLMLLITVISIIWVTYIYCNQAKEQIQGQQQEVKLNQAEKKKEQQLRQRRRRKLLYQLVRVRDVNKKIQQNKQNVIFKQMIDHNTSLLQAANLLKEMHQLQEANYFSITSQRPIKMQQTSDKNIHNKLKQYKNLIQAEKIVKNKEQRNISKSGLFLQNLIRQRDVNDNYQKQQTQILPDLRETNKANQKVKNKDKSSIIKKDSKIDKQDLQLAQIILVEQSKYLQMRGAFDKVKKQMDEPVDPNNQQLMQQFQKIDVNFNVSSDQKNGGTGKK